LASGRRDCYDALQAAKFTTTPLPSDRPIPVKGPGLRIDLDVRRVWRCAKCGKTVRTAGLVTAQRCGCSDGSQWMRLEPPVKREPFVPPHRDPIPEDESEPAAATEIPTIEPVPLAASETPLPTSEIIEPAPRETVLVREALIETVLIEPVPAEAATDTPTPPAPPSDDPAVKTETAPPPTDEFGAGLAN